LLTDVGSVIIGKIDGVRLKKIKIKDELNWKEVRDLERKIKRNVVVITNILLHSVTYYITGS